MQAPKCRTCGERHWGLCPGGAGKVLPKSTRGVARDVKAVPPAAAAVSQPPKQTEGFAGITYGRSPGVLALPDLRALNDLPEAERVAAAAAFIEKRMVCPVCEARRKREAARAKRWRDRKKEGSGG